VRNKRVLGSKSGFLERIYIKWTRREKKMDEAGKSHPPDPIFMIWSTRGRDSWGGWLKKWPKSTFFWKNVKKVKKSRPPAVTKIFMPDFRHAHTLQQYISEPRIVLLSERSFMSSCSVFHICFVFVVLLYSYVVSFGFYYRDPRGYSK